MLRIVLSPLALPSLYHLCHLCNLIPRPPPFFVLQFSFRKSAKKWGRPGNTYHVDDVWWMRGGRRGGGVHVQITY